MRSCWVRPWICSRPRFGGYEALLKDLRVSDCKARQNFCHMSNDDYQQIITLVSPLITYQDTRYRQAISADERLTCKQSRPHQLLRQQLVACSFDMSKEIVKLNMFNLFRHVERAKKSFDMLPKTATCRTATFVAGVDGALQLNL